MSISRATVKGQVLIPAALRNKFNIKKGSRVSVSEGKGNVILIRPLADDPIEGSRGIMKGKTSMTRALVKDRRAEAKRG